MDSRRNFYAHTWGIAAVFFEKQEKGFKLVKPRVWGIRLTRGEEPKSYHADPSEDSERDLFDGRWPSSSEDAALEEEGMAVTGGGRLPQICRRICVSWVARGTGPR